MDDRSLFRYKPGYRTDMPDTVLDWSEWGGFAGAVEMCNNNGACRKRDSDVMCPSFRATGDEKHLTRGRANALRLALSGQLGPDAFTSKEMFDAMSLCVGCKGCQRECPTGVDMARMKIEFLYHYALRHGVSLRDKLFAFLPRYAPLASRLRWLTNLRDHVPGLPIMSQLLFGLSAKRRLPVWHAAPFLGTAEPGVGESGANDREVVLWVDTFNTYYEPENARAALKVLRAAGYTVHVPAPADGGRPVCCGRTFLSAGLVDEAKQEAARLIEALGPYAERGLAIIGLEPSCLLGLRDEFPVMMEKSPMLDAIARQSVLFEEFLIAEHSTGRLELAFQDGTIPNVLLHGHCHQKAHGVMGPVQAALELVPGLDVEVVDSSCCGMAGSFGYQAENWDVSMKMAEAALLPAVRAAPAETMIVADGTSCRHQIRDGAKRNAVHVARILERALASP
jgi:Fe-S oxidoreductase